MNTNSQPKNKKNNSFLFSFGHEKSSFQSSPHGHVLSLESVLLSDKQNSTLEGEYENIYTDNLINVLQEKVSKDIFTISITPNKDTIENLTVQTYNKIFSTIKEISRHTNSNDEYRLARIHNFIPNINKEMNGVEIYQNFNLGRHEAFLNEDILDNVPSATGIGIKNKDLVIVAHFTRNKVAHLQNPNQRPPRLYSEKYGKIPPLFSRATLIETSTGPVLKISGTASILQEGTVHQGDVKKQIHVALENIKTMYKEAGFNLDNQKLTGSAILYVRSKRSADYIQTEFSKHFPHITNTVCIQADICRKDLLAEIEVSVHIH